MNFLRLRPMAHAVFARTYATAPFVPPPSLDTIDPASFRSTHLPRPTSPTFYTARSDFYDALRGLEDAIKTADRALRATHLVPFPDAAKRNLPPPRLAWKNADDLSRQLGATLTTSRQRRVQVLLAQLNDLRRIALAGAEDRIAESIAAVLEPFERPDKDMLKGHRKPVLFDEYRRTYALGKRKESAARVWMIPVRTPEGATEATTATATGEASQADQPPSSQPEQQVQPQEQEQANPNPDPQTLPSPQPDQPLTQLIQVPALHIEATTTTTTILVNNLPLATYFANPIDRQRVVRPLTLAGVLGAFNVFALVRGGGTTGQAGALAHGIAKNIVAHVPEVELILRRAKLLKRDPRMVERKKTGLAKARKRYAWVKR